MSKEMTAVSVKEPLMHISKRDGIEPYKAWLIRLAAVLISLIVCAGVIFALTGLNPIEVYKGVFDGAVGTKRRVWMTIGTPWSCCALQSALPRHLRCGSGTSAQRGRY